MSTLLFLGYVAFTLYVLYQSLHPKIWEVGSIIYLVLATFAIGMSLPAGILMCSLIGVAVLLINVEAARNTVADWLFNRVKKVIPKLSKTEEAALNAGDTWVEQDLFVGRPDWERLSEISTRLTDEEQAFLDNETNTLCEMLNEWDIIQSHDLPESVWQFMKDKGFFGLVIDKAYGGKGFSARAHSEVVMKLATRSGVAAVTVMVPNSLGPGELLQHYGTEEQKQYYLPRLSSGQEIPCFALTEPGAGSDATSIQSEALVVEREVNGKKELGLVVSLNKRWITLSPVATLIGLAVNLKDPEQLLEGVGSEGITCILVSRDTPNLEIGNRHLPAAQPFMNGTIRGQDIYVPISSIIGGQKNAGQGWQMLVECLSIGRSISLPALAAATSSVSYIATSGFARARKQFNVEIGQFEGVQEKLAEIGGLNYLINALRHLTLAAVYEYKKPSVASAITKYFNTEFGRMVVNHAMDIHGGRGVVVGPRNYLANAYQGIPVSITVEGANIMSRNLLIFGQGSMACHPFVREEFYAIAKEDNVTFRDLIWRHVQYTMTNLARAVASSWTNAVLIHAPKGPFHREAQKLTKLSQQFAFLADFSLIMLGGELKRKERLSARLADAMSYLYMAMAVFREAEIQHYDEDEVVHARWALQYCFYHAERAMLGLLSNFPSRASGLALRVILFPLGGVMRAPSDKQDASLAKLMMKNNHYRKRLARSVYLSGNPAEPLDKIEHVFQLLSAHSELLLKVKDLSRVPFKEWPARLADKVKAKELTEDERLLILDIERARWDAIMVDEFEFNAMKHMKYQSVTDKLSTPFDVPKTTKRKKADVADEVTPS